MPKSPTAPSDPVARLTDVALRKKKNADAQAAFRARRANYIATLESSVSHLEDVVIQVQDSLKVVEQERDTYRLQLEEHAKYCAALAATFNKDGKMFKGEELSASPFSDYSHPASHSTRHHPFNSVPYRGDGPPVYTSVLPAHGRPFLKSPTSFQHSDMTSDSSGSTSHLHPARVKYEPYPVAESSRGIPNGWQMPVLHGMHPGVGGQSPSYMNAQTVGQMPEFGGRLCAGSKQDIVDGQCGFADENQYHQHLGHPSRPPSTTSSAIQSSAPIPMTSSLVPFDFADQHEERGPFDYRHHSQLIPAADNPNDPLSGQPTEDLRYRLAGRRENSNGDHLALADEHVQQPGGGGGSHSVNDDPCLRTRRNTHSSRSPSPVRPSISCTVAVIRAQSFGALRRTRASAKKSTEATRITLDVLQSRGIGLRDRSMASKEPPASDDGHDDTNTP